MREFYRSMFSVLVSLTLLSLTALAQQGFGNRLEKEKFWLHNDRGHLIFFAVLEGLYSDGVSNEVVASIIPALEGEERHDSSRNFVYACPLCKPAFEAFRLYESRPEIQDLKKLVGGPRVDTFGKGLSPMLKTKLLSDDDKIRRPALQELVGEWISRYMVRMRLTEAERSEWEARMNAGREEGMSHLQRSKDLEPNLIWENCAVCDAAAGACVRDDKSAPADE